MYKVMVNGVVRGATSEDKKRMENIYKYIGDEPQPTLEELQAQLLLIQKQITELQNI